jgi:hypothetical protein
VPFDFPRTVIPAGAAEAIQAAPEDFVVTCYYVAGRTPAMSDETCHIVCHVR